MLIEGAEADFVAGRGGAGSAPSLSDSELMISLLFLLRLLKQLLVQVERERKKFKLY